MAQFPISTEDAGKEIKALITEKGLDTITSKMIRKHLEAKFNCDFEDCKSNLDELIESCIDELDAETNGESSGSKAEHKSPSSDSSDTDEDLAEPAATSSDKSTKTAPKRQRVYHQHKSMLREAEEMVKAEDMATAIKRRRSAAPPPKPAKKMKKEKGVKREKKPVTMFTKVCVLSPELASLVGKRYMRRSEVVKEIWNYLRANNLQDPKSKQYYFLDEPLKKVFNKTAKRIKAFGMMSKLKHHIKDVDQLSEESRQRAEMEIAEMLAKEEEAAASESGEAKASNSDTGDKNDEEEEEESDQKESPAGTLAPQNHNEDTNTSMQSQDSLPIKSEETTLDDQPSTSQGAAKPVKEEVKEEPMEEDDSDSSDTAGGNESESSSSSGENDDY